MTPRTSFAPAASLLLVLFAVGLAGPVEPDRIDPSKPIPSTALLLTSQLQGSGFLVDRGERLLLTNRHMVQAGQDVEVVFPIWTEAGQILTNRDLYLTRGQRIRGKCLAAHGKRDLAIVQLASVPLTVPEIKLADRGPRVGDKAHLLGNTGMSKQVWIFGFGKVEKVGPLDHTFAPNVHVQARSVVLTTDDRKIGAGASGGPVVNDSGELLGVIQSGPPDSRSVTCIEVSEVRTFLGEFYRKQGTAAIARKDYAEAQARCGRALDVNPSDALAYHECAVAASFQERYDQAIRDYTAAVKLDPHNARAYRGRATAHYCQSEYVRAVEDCTRAIYLDPEYAQAYLSRSRALAMLGRVAEARTDHAAAVKLDPTLK